MSEELPGYVKLSKNIYKCGLCGYEGVMYITKLGLECPNCGNVCTVIPE